MLKYTFDTGKSSFFKRLKEKVDEYFPEEKLDPAGNRRLYIKGAIQLLSATAIYTVLVFFTPVIYVSIVLCIILGLNLAVIGFNVMHEGGHQSFSRHLWVNRLSSYSLNLLGGTIYYWK